MTSAGKVLNLRLFGGFQRQFPKGKTVNFPAKPVLDSTESFAYSLAVH